MTVTVERPTAAPDATTGPEENADKNAGTNAEKDADTNAGNQ